MTPGRPTPWHEAIAAARAMHGAAQAAGMRGLLDFRADEVKLWMIEIEDQVTEYHLRAIGQEDGDPRAALIGLIGIAGAAVAAMDNADPVR